MLKQNLACLKKKKVMKKLKYRFSLNRMDSTRIISENSSGYFHLRLGNQRN